jgi:hypothetical protein
VLRKSVLPIMKNESFISSTEPAELVGGMVPELGDLGIRFALYVWVVGWFRVLDGAGKTCVGRWSWLGNGLIWHLVWWVHIVKSVDKGPSCMQGGH